MFEELSIFIERLDQLQYVVGEIPRQTKTIDGVSEQVPTEWYEVDRLMDYAFGEDMDLLYAGLTIDGAKGYWLDRFGKLLSLPRTGQMIPAGDEAADNFYRSALKLRIRNLYDGYSAGFFEALENIIGATGNLIVHYFPTLVQYNFFDLTPDAGGGYSVIDDNRQLILGYTAGDRAVKITAGKMEVDSETGDEVRTFRLNIAIPGLNLGYFSDFN